LRLVTSPDDPHLVAFSHLLDNVFPDPNMVLGLDRLQAFVRADPSAATRRFFVLVALDQASDMVVGGSVFSYVRSTNCGFSEYIVTDRTARGMGLGRRLFDRRKAILDSAAHEQGHPACEGLFIEADNPERTPPDLIEAERQTALDARERLRLFHHLGFRKVQLPYIQPPLAPDKAPIDYLDLLFAPWPSDNAALDRIPAAWVFDTVEPVWSAWSPDAPRHLLRLRQRVATTDIRLASLDTPPTR
jgi:GNAT superfamily N-acetyltransferase